MQYYWSARASAKDTRHGRKSSMTDKDLKYLAMQLHCSNATKVDEDGHKAYTQPFWYIEAAFFLSHHPKYGGLPEDQ